MTIVSCEYCGFGVEENGWCRNCHDRDHREWRNECGRCRERANARPRNKSYLPPRERRLRMIRDVTTVIIVIISALAVSAVIAVAIWAALAYEADRSEGVRNCVEAKVLEYGDRYGIDGENFRDRAEIDCGLNQ